MLHYIITAILVFNFVAIITVIFFERKNPASSLAWILLLSFLPVLGFLLYLFLGSGFRFRKQHIYAHKSGRDDEYEDVLLQELMARNQRVFEASGENRIHLLPYLEHEGNGCYTSNNQIEVFTDGNDMFSRLLQDIRAAKKHIHLLYYIFKDDRIGSKIVEALRERARCGVEVRLLYDGVGSFLTFGPGFRELRQDGAEVNVFSPMFGTFTSSLNLNYRNHRKITVIDGEIGYVGGMNIGDEYMSRNPRLSPWRDTHTRMTGSAVWFLQERFLMDWNHVTQPPPENIETIMKYFPPVRKSGKLGIQVASGGPDALPGNPIKGGLLRMFYGARKTLYIQTPYFAPDESIIDALQIAAKTGVDVRLMIPGRADHKLVHKATFGYARQILASGVRVFMYRGFLHAKTAEADGVVATIGTANLSNRSFNMNFEINIFVHNDEFAAEQESVFLRDLENCEELTEQWFKQQSLFNRVLYNGARLITPLV